MSTDAFIPEEYEAPSSGGGYTKLELGETKLRILSSPLMLWVVWEGGKATKIKYAGDANKPTKPSGENASVKHVWALVVYNYGTSQIEVLELDKMTLITPLTAHSKDPDWGHPKGYDVIFKKEGSGRENTKYTFIAKPHSAITEEIKEAFISNPIDLNELLKPEGNPFLNGEISAKTEAQKPVETSVAAKTITPENWSKGDAVPHGYKLNPAGDEIVKDLPF